jgi:acyl carrier protein
MTEADVFAFLTTVFKDVFGRDMKLTPELAARDVVGWDSLRQVEITLALEEKYHLRIRARELNDVANLGDLVALVIAKTKDVA